MIFQPYYLECLAHASYMVGDKGEAIIIDPQRDVDGYVADAKAAGLTIVGVVETHLHADFVSGHLELAHLTGAKIFVSHLANVEYPHAAVKDGDEIAFGGLVLQILETPGHTPESISLVLSEEGAPTHLFSGDTLFIGEIGRPDLAGWRGHSQEELARSMFRSLRDKILPLPDSIEVWPAHGAGSACGKAISDEPSSSLGVQKQGNWGLRLVAEGKETEFLAELTSNLPRIPPYFPHDVLANRRGSSSLRAVVSGARPLSASVLDEESRIGTVVLDTRSAHDFAAGHVPCSINVGLDGKFAPWVGVVIPSTVRLVLVCDEGRETEALMRLARIGYENVVGWLEGGMQAWQRMGRWVAKLPELQAQNLDTDKNVILDVRTPTEWAEGHLEGAVHIPLLELETRIAEVPKGALVVMCRSGYRSTIACSLLESRGWEHLQNLQGGWLAYESCHATVAQTP